MCSAYWRNICKWSGWVKPPTQVCQTLARCAFVQCVGVFETDTIACNSLKEDLVQRLILDSVERVWKGVHSVERGRSSSTWQGRAWLHPCFTPDCRWHQFRCLWNILYWLSVCGSKEIIWGKVAWLAVQSVCCLVSWSSEDRKQVVMVQRRC